MVNQCHLSGNVTVSNSWFRFHSGGDARSIGIGKVHNMTSASKVFRKLVLHCVIFGEEFSHKLGVRSPESINILIIIANGNHSHGFISLHQSFNQSKVVFTHILGFINNQNTFGNFVLFYVSFPNHFSGFFNDIVCFVKCAGTPQKIEAV